jgi:hypothetical protein
LHFDFLDQKWDFFPNIKFFLISGHQKAGFVSGFGSRLTIKPCSGSGSEALVVIAFKKNPNNILQATTGSGGWPLSVFLTPGLKPVYGGTYFPPAPTYGRPAFTQILEALAKQWQDDPVRYRFSG